MPREVQYQSPKKNAGTKMKSGWIAEDDTHARAHLEKKGWTIVGTREKPSLKPQAVLNPLPALDANPEIEGDTLLLDPEGELENSTTDPVRAEGGTKWSIEGISDEQLQALSAKGYDSLDKLRAASDAELREVQGIGTAAVRNIRKALADTE